MKKEKAKIQNPDELNKNLSYNSPITWIILGSVILALVGFLVWSAVAKIQIKISGKASVAAGTISLHVEESRLSELKEGQKVYIAEPKAEGTISSFDANKQPVVTGFTLPEGEYDYYIVIKELKPIEFWFNNN